MSATAGSGGSSDAPLSARDVRVTIDEVVSNRVRIAEAEMGEQPVRELSVGEKFFVDVADVFAWQSKQKAEAAAAAAAALAATATSNESSTAAGASVTTPSAAAATATTPPVWPFAMIEQKLNMARFQLDNISRVIDWINHSHPLSLRQVDLVQAQAVANMQTASAATNTTTNAPAGSAGANGANGKSGAQSDALETARRRATRFATVAAIKQKQLEGSGGILTVGATALRSSLASTKNYIHDIKMLRSFWKVYQYTTVPPNPSSAAAASAVIPPLNAIDTPLIVDFAIPNLADGAPIGHSGRALIKRDPTDGHIRIDGLTELLSEGGDLLLTDANGATSGWLVCWQQLKRAQQLLVHKQLYARMRKEANLLGRSTPFADNGGEDDSASDPSAAAATVAVSGSGSGGLPITATVLDNGLVVEHAPFPPITFTFPRGGVDGFVVSGDGLSSALQSVLCWNAALRIFLRRRHAPRAPTASERTVLGKAAARQQAMATANAAAASGSTSGSAAAAVAAVAALRDSSADGSTAGSGSGNSVWLIPRLVRALNFHRLQARIRRILDELVLESAAAKPPIHLFVETVGSLSVESAIPLSRSYNVYAALPPVSAGYNFPRRFVFEASIVGTELTVIIDRGASFAPAAASPIAPVPFSTVVCDAKHFQHIVSRSLELLRATISQ